MPVNHTEKFFNSAHAVALFSWLFIETLTSYFVLMRKFFQKNFWLKSLLSLSTVSGWMPKEI